MAPATQRQEEVLVTLHKLTKELGFPPTMVELSVAMGCSPKSREGMASNVRALKAKGLVTTKPRTARSMTLTEEGLAVICSLEKSV
jgi:SOS-response transcriptional repressor LexA